MSSSALATKQVLLITGCSSGLGYNLVQHFLAAGHSVAATARNVASVQEFETKYPKTALALSLDVTDQDSIAKAIAKTVEKFGRIDVLINNAGFSIVTAAENYSARELKQVMETNFFGAIFTSQAVLPIMRKQHSGAIIQVSSGLGVASMPASTIYSASKFALEGFSEGLAQEVASHNIRVVVVEPGTFTTSFGDKIVHPANTNVDEYPAVQQFINVMGKMRGAEFGDPKKFAVVIEKILALENPPLRIPLGSDSLHMIQGHIAQQQADLEKYKHLTTSTDYDPLPQAAIELMQSMLGKK
ncbi:SDR family oxidoreductase [Brasilonema sp. CT11]|nr:SDR family oxidoreductase [Brasilonema sp. CT11]